jgi:pyruvate/2-oxoglutarate dehydrogenase complex dihydrolipoamide acyltransferase (E2) component
MERLSTRRKLAFATWGTSRDGNVYGRMVVNATQALRYLRKVRDETGEKATITHLVGKAAGQALVSVPGLNGRILFGRYFPHRTADVGFLVALEEGANLGNAKVQCVDRKSVPEIAHELRRGAEELRARRNQAFEKSQSLLRLMPNSLVGPVLSASGFFAAVLGVNLKALGLHPFPFGGCIVTNIGTFGLDEGFAPPMPFAHVPLTIVVGSVRDLPYVENGAVVVRPQVTLCATVDHRFVDGFQIGQLAKIIRDVVENPWQLS